MGTALVTGASAGLGAEFARQLAAKGHDIVLVARDEERLQAMAAELASRYVVTPQVLPADLSTDAGMAAVVARLSDPTRPVDLLVNNAGFGQSSTFLDNDIEAEVDALRVMAEAVMRLSYAAAQGMRERGHGAILNVASVAAWAPMGSYSAIKSLVLLFTQGLANELVGSGVTATVLNPGLTRTEFHERAQWATTSYPSFAWLSAESVVREALADVNLGKVVSTPSLRYQAVSVLTQHLPRGLLRCAVRGVDKGRTSA